MRDQLELFNMDIVALYPSIMRDMAMKAVSEAIVESKIEWDNVEVTSLTRDIAMNFFRKEIERLRIQDIIPVPKG